MTSSAKNTSSGATTRLHVNLNARSKADLEDIRRLRDVNATDATNRAIQVYALIERAAADGQRLAFYNPAKDEFTYYEVV